MSKKITYICDLTGQENAVAFRYPTGELEDPDPASGKRDNEIAEVDLSHDGAIQLLYAITSILHGNQFNLTATQLHTIVKKKRKQYLEQTQRTK